MSVGDVEEARIAIKAGAQAICLGYNLLQSEALDDLVTEIATAGCGVLARSPLLYGLLSGTWSSQRKFAEEDHRSRRWAFDAFEARLEQVDELRFLIGPDHPDLATAALRYVLTNTLVSTAIVGARTPYQVSTAVEAADAGPPYVGDEDMARIKKLL